MLGFVCNMCQAFPNGRRCSSGYGQHKPALLISYLAIFAMVTSMVASNVTRDTTEVVKVSQGLLRGKWEQTQNQFQYLAFKGVRYAQPPLGDLRFKAPHPLLPWDGIKDALEHGSDCVQPFGGTRTGGDEDCLFLNVYTPKLPGSGKEALPVLVYLPGGPYSGGGASSYGPDYLVAQGLVVVTVNYRNGALGFMSLGPQSDIPGNAGLKDQTAALRWVRDNIAAFGGDPKEVTLFGQSAGASSAHLQVLSPMAKGLFKRAIILSGSAANYWSVTNEAERRSRSIAQSVGCPVSNMEILTKCLRKVDAHQLTRNLAKARNEKDMRFEIIALPFAPVVESPNGPEEPFMVEDPIEVLRKGDFTHIPVIMGTVTQESFLWLVPDAMPVSRPPGLREVERVDNDPTILVPDAIYDNVPDNKTLTEIGQSVKRLYFGGKNISADTMNEFFNVLSDIWFVHEWYTALRLMAKTRAPAFMYLQSFGGEFSSFKKMNHINLPGVGHTDSIPYIFSPVGRPPMEPKSASEILVRERVTKMIADFVKTSNPTPTVTSLVGVKWLPYELTSQKYMDVGEELEMKTNFLSERMKFWDNLHAKYGNRDVYGPLLRKK